MRLQLFVTVALVTSFVVPVNANMGCGDAHNGSRIMTRMAASPHAGQILSSLIRGPRAALELKADQEMAVQSEKQVQQEIEAGYSQWKNQNWLSKTRTAYEAIHKWTGNPYESAVRMKRIALGERFYRLMRAGDVVRAVNYVRRLFDLRPHAEAMLWAQLRIHQLEKEIESSGPEGVGNDSRRMWIYRFKNIVETEAKYLKNYGDMKMIVYQFNRIKIKFDNSVDPRLKSTLIELTQKVMEGRVPTRNALKELITTTESEMAKETGSKPLTAVEIEQYVNERILNVSGRVSEMPYLRSTFPDLFRIDDGVVVAREYKDAIERSINLEADFVGSIYHGHFLRSLGIRGYGQHLPAQATAYREIAWETLGAIKNVLGVAIKTYGVVARSISRNNLEAIVDAKQEQESTEYKQVASWKRGFNRLTLANRKALKWILEDLTVYDALNVHAPKIDILENLLQKKQAGFETQKSYVDMVRTFAASEGGASALKNKDFLISFARIEEYADAFRETLEIVRSESETVKTKYPGNATANIVEKNLLDAMEEAWKMTNDGTVSRISLHTEPNMVSHVAKQIFTFGAGTFVTIKGVLYAIDPATWTALKQWMPTIF